MGATIHFQGRLRNVDDYQKIIDIGKQLGAGKKSKPIIIDSEKHSLIRVKDGKVVEYEGKVSGIIFGIHDKCEPIILEFDKDYYIEQFCKTQYAGFSAHIELVEFLRRIEPFFDQWRVLDESGFWDNADVELLKRRLQN